MKNGILLYTSQYYSELNEMLTSRFDETFDNGYYDLLCSNPSLLDDYSKVFYFNQLIMNPLKLMIEYIVDKGSVSVDGIQLPNEYRLSINSMEDILKTASPKCRKMMLKKIDCPSNAYSDLESGFLLMDVNALQRAAEKVDFTNDFKRISFLRSIAFAELKDKHMSFASLDEEFYNVLLFANGRPYDEGFKKVLSARLHGENGSAEATFSIAKRLIKDCYWNNYNCFTSREKIYINKVLSARLFSSFIGECRKEFKKEHPKVVFSDEGIIDDYSKKKTDDVPANVIMGVRGLAKFVGVGVTKAQEIVNSKILEENGISYWVGRKICFDGEKLAAFLTSNPDALKGKKLSKKR